MSPIERICTSGMVAALFVALGTQPVAAATRPAKPAAPAPVVHAAGAPRVFMITPARVHPDTEPNIMLEGQNLTPTTQVLVGGRPATTLEATGTTLLAKLPDGLAGGDYPLVVTLDGVSSEATDPVVVDDSAQGPSTTTWLILGLAGGLFVLIRRLSQPRRYAWSR